MAIQGTEMLADYGDGVLHRFGWWRKRVSLPFARCRSNGEVQPEHVRLESTAAEGSPLCPWCMEDLRAPTWSWLTKVPKKRVYRMRVGQVPNAELREAFERSGLTPAEVAVRLGWVMPDGRGDGRRVLRKLGLLGSHRNREGRARVQRSTRADIAVAIADALGYAPVDLGL
jgi:hypothetical protein